MTAPLVTPLLTEIEAAALLGISERTMRDLRLHGHIRYVAVSKRMVRYRPEDCQEYIEAHVRAATPPRPTRPGPKLASRNVGNVTSFTHRKRSQP